VEISRLLTRVFSPKMFAGPAQTYSFYSTYALNHHIINYKALRVTCIRRNFWYFGIKMWVHQSKGKLGLLRLCFLNAVNYRVTRDEFVKKSPKAQPNPFLVKIMWIPNRGKMFPKNVVYFWNFKKPASSHPAGKNVPNLVTQRLVLKMCYLLVIRSSSARHRVTLW
jgi:hypothetical protein